MQQAKNNYLIWSGIAAAAGGLLHVAVIFGGPAWYRLIGATEPIVRLAAKGHAFPVIVCLFAAAVLFACAGFAFSGAGLIPRLPFLRTALVLITTALLIHGVAFIPLVLLWPQKMIGLYDGVGINAILIVTSAICLATGLGFAAGTRRGWHRSGTVANRT
ncbi:hypothetical protein [Massilia glaciei]|uniref:Uncharacterized protein n=1 Tax=Massilia glaciei TaxID=1524097 RepID=A0A2U2HP98_9BURK|nr:hypothetical protein [Massilia glaciei]PWF49340.1 hypothetical protein C7C56_006850 [Massilia glaciei]